MDTIRVAVISAFVVCLGIIAALSVLYWQYAGEGVNLEKQNQDLQQVISSLRDENSRLNSDIDALRTANQNLILQADDLNKQAAGLRQQNVQLQQQIDSLRKAQNEKCPTTQQPPAQPNSTTTPPGMGINDAGPATI
ncbi:MAG: hypothetical protein HY813_01360 [Candidatus Portnoybacteria bacterium]|nr:hypothetical protein [Candidatus Portnoybacteria bacterium]